MANPDTNGASGLPVMALAATKEYQLILLLLLLMLLLLLLFLVCW